MAPPAVTLDRARASGRERHDARVVVAGLAIAVLVAVCGACAWAAPPALHGGTARPVATLSSFDTRYRELLADHRELIRAWPISYTTAGGARRHAIVLLPRWYGPYRHPAIPLVISPHGRGVSAEANTHFWGGLPAYGPFAVVNPEGQGRRLTLYSWGWRGQIDDLARMPSVVTRALPWLRLDRRRIYALGSSMGGQEVLLLVALHPHLLAGAAALDSATDMAARYRAFRELRGGSWLQWLARDEIGGTPRTNPRGYAARSPISFAREIARSGVPLHIWWSTRDRIVRNQRDESGLLYRRIKAIAPRAPVTEYVGRWAHSKEMHALARLPLALVRLGLIRLDGPSPSLAP